MVASTDHHRLAAAERTIRSWTIVALVVTVVVVLVALVIGLRQVGQLTSMTADINAAGRQRMLVQRIALGAASGDAELIADSTAWLVDINAHLRDGASLALADVAPPATLVALDRYLELAASAAAGDLRALAALPDEARQLAPALDDVTTAYEHTAAQRLGYIRRIALALAVATITVAFVTWLTIVRPSARRLAVAHDTTAAALHRVEELLERERDVLVQLQRVDAMKDTLLSTVSHDLRTPLTVVAGLVDTLRRHDHLDAQQRADLLDRVDTNAQRLTRLVSDLLDLRHTNLDGIDLRPVNVDAVMADQLAVMDPDGRTIVADLRLVSATTNPVMIGRIVDNLVGNAIKHTDRGSTIWVRLSADADRFRIVVEDDGTGISAADRQRILEPFERGGHTASHVPGQGIGLALVQQFARHLGGSIDVSERAGGGAQFVVDLPRNPTD